MPQKTADRLEYLKVTSTVAMILLCVVAFFKYYKGSVNPAFDIVFGVSLVLLFGGIISPKFAELFTKGWTALGHAMGYVMSRIILTSIFYLFLTPIALLYRLTHKNPLKLKKDGLESYYETRNHKYLPRDLENMW